MTSIEILLIKWKKDTKGRNPIAIRITKDRKPKYKFLEYIEAKHWNSDKSKVKTSNLDYKLINNKCDNEKSRASNIVRDFDAKGISYTSLRVINILKNKGSVSVTFFDIANNFLENINTPDNHNSYQTQRKQLENFRSFLKGKNIMFEEITEDLLKRYIVFLKTTGRSAQNTINGHLSMVRKIFNEAINKNYVGKEFYPFSRKGVNTPTTNSIKIPLNSKEISLFENIDLIDKPSLDHTRNIWLFSFYFAGIRIADTLKLKWSDFQNGRLYYRMGKNEKVDSLKIPSKADAILQIYRLQKISNMDYVFPELKKINPKDLKAITKKINNVKSQFNKNLKLIAKRAGIEKNLTNHIARHTFGNMAAGKIPLQSLQKLYRHSYLSTTTGYQNNFNHEETDDALEKVLDF